MRLRILGPIFLILKLEDSFLSLYTLKLVSPRAYFPPKPKALRPCLYQQANERGEGHRVDEAQQLQGEGREEDEEAGENWARFEGFSF